MQRVEQMAERTSRTSLRDWALAVTPNKAKTSAISAEIAPIRIDCS